ncbi:transmembrane protein 170B isoform X2 [Marmota flaviventris]|uniref:transmembrane protein 170B isoform X2 n=1 Tax=Marmota flaviventris TaxID=93162 RepID=UPI003A8620A9
MKAEGGDHSMINLSVQQVLSLWAHGTVLRNLTEMWYWIFLWALFSSLFVHGAAGVLMFVMLQRHRQGRVISVIAVSIGFLASVTGAMITRNRAGAIEDPVGHLPSCNQDSGLNFVKNGSAVRGASWMQKLRAGSCPLRPLSLLIKVIIRLLCLLGRPLGWPANFAKQKSLAPDSSPVPLHLCARFTCCDQHPLQAKWFKF